MLRMVTPAADRSLLTIEELRTAVGATAPDQDPALLALGLRVADLIALACGVTRAGAAPPTLRREILRERKDACGGEIVLSRRFVEVLDATTVGVAIDPADLDVDFSTGIVAGSRFAEGAPIDIVYAAGFEVVPEDLKFAALSAVREFHSADSRDPLLRAETTDEVGRLEFQVGGTGRLSGSALPVLCHGAIAPYVRPAVG